MSSMEHFKLLKIEPVTARVSEQEGRLFYVLWQYLCRLAIRVYPGRDSLVWKENEHYAANSVPTRALANDVLITYYEKALAEASKAMRKPCPLLLTTSSLYFTPGFSVLTAEHIFQMREWASCRVEGYFFFLGLTSEGALLAYLGESEKDECVYVVKGLASSYTSLLKLDEVMTKEKEEEEEALHMWTVLLGWRDTIVYYSVLIPRELLPKTHMQNQARLDGVLQRCVAKNRVYSKLTPSNAKFCEFEGGAKSDSRMYLPRFAVSRDLARLTVTAGVTCMDVTTTYWSQYLDRMKPYDLNSVLEPAPGVIIEGFKCMVTTVAEVKDSDSCVLCRSGKPFAECCRGEHRRREEKARQKGDALIYCVDVLTRESVEKDSNVARSLFERLSLMNFYSATFKLAGKHETDELRRRLLEAVPWFRRSSEVTWDYIGPLPLYDRHMNALMPFGSLELLLDTDSFLVTTNSTERAQTIIEEIGYLCKGLHMSAPQIEVTSVSGQLARKQTSTSLASVEQLVQGLSSGGAQASTKTSRMFQRSCSFCGEEGELKACSGCKQARYCSRECQKSHWPKHKKGCGKAAGA